MLSVQLLLGTFEAMGGLILFGASTVFLLGLMGKLFDDAPKTDQVRKQAN